MPPPGKQEEANFGRKMRRIWRAESFSYAHAKRSDDIEKDERSSKRLRDASRLTLKIVFRCYSAVMDAADVS